MLLQRDTGYTAVTFLGSTTEYRLPLAEYERVRIAWMRGVAFIDTVSYFGAALTIKGARIEMVERWLPEHVAACGAHTAAMRTDDAIGGGV